MKLANTAGEAWKFTHLKRKTDRDDARKLADLEALGHLPTVVLPDPPTRQRRMLIAYRQELVTQRVRCQNRIRSLFAGVGLPTPVGAKAWSEIGLAGIASQSKPLAECGPDELWRGMLSDAVAEYRSVVKRLSDIEKSLDGLSRADAATQLLMTIPGVGPRTAEAVAAHLGDPTRFASAKQVGAYAGLVPTQYQSGTTDRKGRITRRGPGVFARYDTPDLPRTNNDLEQAFVSHRYHERRASGRKGASPSLVLRRSAKVIAGLATRTREVTADDLADADRQRWQQLRAELDERRQRRTDRRRFRQDPEAYLNDLEIKLHQSRLPA